MCRLMLPHAGSMISEANLANEGEPVLKKALITGVTGQEELILANSSSPKL